MSETRRESYTSIETFLNYEDARTWLDGHVSDFKELGDEYVLEQASINYINHQWRAGFVVSKTQGDLFKGGFSDAPISEDYCLTGFSDKK
jgi:hypothetical protein